MLAGRVARGSERAKQVMLEPEPVCSAVQLPNTPKRVAVSAEAGTAATVSATLVRSAKIAFMCAQSFAATAEMPLESGVCVNGRDFSGRRPALARFPVCATRAAHTHG